MTKAQRGGLKFSEWAEREFPGISVKNEVHAAVWYATEFPSVKEKDIPAGKHSAQHIRDWFNGLQPKAARMPKSSKPDEDLSEAQGPATVERKELTKDTARCWLLVLPHRLDSLDQPAALLLLLLRLGQLTGC